MSGRNTGALGRRRRPHAVDRVERAGEELLARLAGGDHRGRPAAGQHAEERRVGVGEAALAREPDERARRLLELGLAGVAFGKSGSGIGVLANGTSTLFWQRRARASARTSRRALVEPHERRDRRRAGRRRARRARPRDTSRARLLDERDLRVERRRRERARRAARRARTRAATGARCRATGAPGGRRAARRAAPGSSRAGCPPGIANAATVRVQVGHELLERVRRRATARRTPCPGRAAAACRSWLSVPRYASAPRARVAVGLLPVADRLVEAGRAARRSSAVEYSSQEDAGGPRACRDWSAVSTWSELHREVRPAYGGSVLAGLAAPRPTACRAGARRSSCPRGRCRERILSSRPA